jgi:hypothetical protein
LSVAGVVSGSNIAAKMPYLGACECRALFCNLNGQGIGKPMLRQLSKIAEASKHYLFFGLREYRSCAALRQRRQGVRLHHMFSKRQPGGWRDSSMAVFSCLKVVLIT